MGRWPVRAMRRQHSIETLAVMDTSRLLLVRALRRLLLAAAVAATGVGCASLPEPVDRPHSAAVDMADADTPLARTVRDSTPAHADNRSGFRLLADGDHAFDARLALARRAQRSLDIQYYLIADDDIGRRFAAELRAAAVRGVRVRLLVDDLYAGQSERLLDALAATPNIEVRLFNPLPARSGSPAGRVLKSLFEFDRINRRMHNKLFIADSTLAITGGRNIADDYFKRGEASNFIDMDTLVSGAAVPELAQLFDRFWNSRQAYGLDALRKAPPTEASPLGDALADLPLTAFDRFGRAPVSAQLAAGRIDLHFADARLLADSPEKADADGADADSPAPTPALESALQAMLAARSEVLLATPYLVPGPRGLELMRRARDNGVRVVMMTNAFAATDEPLVHWGYARYRSQMLQLGVELYELSPTVGRSALARGETGSSLGRLHAKLAVIDRQRLLVGSMNMDARSMRSNTELALLIESPALADEVARTLQRDRETSTYRLRAGARPAGVEWVESHAGREVVHHEEPDAGWATRLKLNLLSMFVAEELL